MIYEKIKELAEKDGISIASLERKLSIGNGTIRKWNEASPTLESISKVARHFEVSIEYFLEEKKTEQEVEIHERIDKGRYYSD